MIDSLFFNCICNIMNYRIICIFLYKIYNGGISIMIRQTLQPYVPLADMLVRTFGKGCEVVLHDLTDPQHSVVYVANNAVTGRQIGESFSSLVDQVLLSPDLKQNSVSNYYFHTKDINGGKLVRSSTLLIRKEDGTLDGALCINLDTEPFTEMISFLQSFLPEHSASLNFSKEEVPQLNEEENVSVMVSSLIDHILKDISLDSTREERVEKIRFMENKGIFLMKGSVEQVAEKMGVNKVTIYSYLDEVHGKRR